MTRRHYAHVAGAAAVLWLTTASAVFGQTDPHAGHAPAPAAQDSQRDVPARTEPPRSEPARTPPSGREPAPRTQPSRSEPAPHDHQPDQSSQPTPAAPPATQHEHGVEPAGAPPAASATSAELPAFIPRVTEADRRQAFPDVGPHPPHGTRLNAFLLVDQLEWQHGGGPDIGNVDLHAWFGGDRNRLWFRAEGDRDDARIGDAQAHVLGGRQVSRWWDVVGGVRHDQGTGPSRTWLAFGIQGLAPYFLQVEATGYVGGSGRTLARVEVASDVLLTNRLIAQPLLEVEVAGKGDPARRTGAGLTSTQAGLRVRYEWRREVAPYAGVQWSRPWGGTADLARAAGDSLGGARLVFGLRTWF